MARIVYDPGTAPTTKPLFGGKRGMRGPERFDWATRPAVAKAAGLTVAAVRRAEREGRLDMHDLASVVRWVGRRLSSVKVLPSVHVSRG